MLSAAGDIKTPSAIGSTAKQRFTRFGTTTYNLSLGKVLCWLGIYSEIQGQRYDFICETIKNSGFVNLNRSNPLNTHLDRGWSLSLWWAPLNSLLMEDDLPIPYVQWNSQALELKPSISLELLRRSGDAFWNRLNFMESSSTLPLYRYSGKACCWHILGYFSWNSPFMLVFYLTRSSFC